MSQTVLFAANLRSPSFHFIHVFIVASHLSLGRVLVV